MDGLDNEERTLAWLASWNPSFEGKAIVDKDYVFRSVNEQFCRIAGVTPAEIINQSFSDLTPQPIKELDLKNAELVKKNVIQSYLLPKSYEFKSGHRVDITLLVNGVYHPKTQEFLFFVSTIMAKAGDTELQPPSPQRTRLLDFIDLKKVGWTVFLGLVAVAAAVVERILK